MKIEIFHLSFESESELHRDSRKQVDTNISIGRSLWQTRNKYWLRNTSKGKKSDKKQQHSGQKSEKRDKERKREELFC